MTDLEIAGVPVFVFLLVVLIAAVFVSLNGN
jgi:hypothetical protein